MARVTRGRPRSFDRNAALDKAIRLFWRKGYEATSMRDLTTELDIAAPSLYRAFGDKEQLFAEAVTTYDVRYGGFIDAALREEQTGADAAIRILREAPGAYTRRGLPTGCLIVSGDAGSANPDVTREVHYIRTGKSRALAARFAGDVAAGVLPAGTEPSALARYVMVVITGLAGAARDGAGRTELARIAQIAIAALPRREPH